LIRYTQNPIFHTDKKSEKNEHNARKVLDICYELWYYVYIK